MTPRPMAASVNAMPLPRRHRSRRGFTLIELVIAMIVFAVAVIGLSTAINMIRKQSTQTRFRAQAASLGVGVIEQARLVHYDSIPATFGPITLLAQGGSFSVSGTSTDSATILKTLQVRISYSSQYGGTKVDTFTTRIAK